MFARTLEEIQSSAPKRAIYVRALLAALATCVALSAIGFARLGPWHRDLVDFDVFHIVAQRVWLGDADLAYQFEKFFSVQQAASGGSDDFMPWTYPPQFDLLLAPFALMSTGTAYFLFTAATLVFYLIVLRSIAASHFVLALIVLLPAMEVTIACGQNGFLTAGLIGLVCLFIEERPIAAGLALGLMVIKPHLAITFAAYAILARRWIVVVTAGTVVLVSSLLCTLVFGPQIWAALMRSAHDSAIFLERGYYQLYRMISFYAALRTLGLSASAAFLGQAVVAACCLGIIAIAWYRQFPARCCLGLTAMLAVSISPYAYDYDLPIFGIGLALLLPELKRGAGEGERAFIYVAPMIVGAYGNLMAAGLGTSHKEGVDMLSIGGLVLVALIPLNFVISLRSLRFETKCLPMSTEAA
jgi:Glycosyltransferase family 87